MVYIPTELVLEILTRLPWTSLRRLRLVCRTWRDLVHQRTTEMQQCRDAVPLVVTTESVYVLDSKTGTARPGRTACNIYKNMEVVGACNGVLCLCNGSTRCRLDAGLVSVNGATYWVTEGSKEKIMSFDHRSEQVRSTKPLPVSARRPICQLTQVHRKLSAATGDQIHGRDSIEVWVLEIEYGVGADLGSSTKLTLSSLAMAISKTRTSKLHLQRV
ncbi:hypothetical protein ACQ4PT_071562 [Festuca glaucescens]